MSDRSRRVNFRTHQAGKLFSLEQKLEVYATFCNVAGPDFTDEVSCSQGWAQFLLFLADNGFSDKTNSSDDFKVEVQPPITPAVPAQGGNQAVPAVVPPLVVLHGNKYNEILEGLRELPYYTNLRCGSSFCEETRVAVLTRDTGTTWAKKHGVPDEYADYGFPGAENCRLIPREALIALDSARNHALSSSKLHFTNLFQQASDEGRAFTAASSIKRINF
jgi:hypothetical protein